MNGKIENVLFGFLMRKMQTTFPITIDPFQYIRNPSEREHVIGGRFRQTSVLSQRLCLKGHHDVDCISHLTESVMMDLG